MYVAYLAAEEGVGIPCERVWQYVSAAHNVFGQCVFGFVMTETIDAGYKDHCVRTILREMNGIVTGFAYDALMRIV